MRIVFMGTPEFAVSSLDILVQHGYDIVGVITAPDRQSGRGRKISQSAVKKYALAQSLNVLQPTNLKSPAFIEALKALNADLQIVVAFRMLPEVVWNMPPKGTVNLHASLLPQYRGAAPINWAIINGESTTGVTTFFIQHEIDTGDLLLQQEIPMDEEETAGSLHDKLMIAGAKLVLETVRGIENDSISPIPQKIESKLRKAPKIFKEYGAIDWSQTTTHIHQKIKGLSPYPAAYTGLHGKTLKIFSARKTISKHGFTPGHCNVTEDNALRYYASDGWLELTSVQLEGKRRMDIEDFLRGYSWPQEM